MEAVSSVLPHKGEGPPTQVCFYTLRRLYTRSHTSFSPYPIFAAIKTKSLYPFYGKQAAKRRYYEHLMASLIYTAKEAGFTVITFADVYQYLVETQQWNSVSNPVVAEIQNYQDAATFDQVLFEERIRGMDGCSRALK